MKLRSGLIAVAICSISILYVPVTSARAAVEQGAPLEPASRSIYEQGHDALSRRDWNAAFERFQALERELATSGAEPADAAIYWQAYALDRAGRTREAGAAVQRLRASFPASGWLDDADALAARKQGAVRGVDSPGGEREADALMALDALLAGGSAQAVPLLQRVLSGQQSDRIKSRAIFVLSQIDPAAADSALAAVLAGDASPGLKAEAIRMIAAGGKRESMDRLLSIHRSEADRSVKHAILDAFLISDRPDLLRQVIEAETDADERHDAIRKLGAMGDGEALMQLYSSRKDNGDRSAVISALGIAGKHDALVELAGRETDPALRADAIRAIGIAGGKQAGAALLGLYRPGQTEAEASAVIEGMMIAGATGQMIALYRKETDPQRKRDLLRKISANDPDAAIELIDKALGNGGQ